MAVYADLVRYRDLFANLFRRDLHAKYRGSALGILWSLVNPLALVLVYLVVVGVIWNKTKGIPHYPLYLIAGLAPWSFFATSLQTASRSMVDSADLIRKVRFPRQLVAFSVVATQAVTFAVMIVIVIVLSLIFIPSARTTVWLVLPLAPLYAAFVAGLALTVACVNAILRDVEHILTAALLPWFFLTPVLWSFATLDPSQTAHHKLIELLKWGNFVAPPLAAVRDSLWSGHAPSAANVIYLAAAAVISLGLGSFVFSRVDDRLAVEL